MALMASNSFLAVFVSRVLARVRLRVAPLFACAARRRVCSVSVGTNADFVRAGGIAGMFWN